MRRWNILHTNRRVFTIFWRKNKKEKVAIFTLLFRRNCINMLNSITAVFDSTSVFIDCLPVSRIHSIILYLFIALVINHKLVIGRDSNQLRSHKFYKKRMSAISCWGWKNRTLQSSSSSFATKWCNATSFFHGLLLIFNAPLNPSIFKVTNLVAKSPTSKTVPRRHQCATHTTCCECHNCCKKTIWQTVEHD